MTYARNTKTSVPRFRFVHNTPINYIHAMILQIDKNLPFRLAMCSVLNHLCAFPPGPRLPNHAINIHHKSFLESVGKVSSNLWMFFKVFAVRLQVCLPTI